MEAVLSYLLENVPWIAAIIVVAAVSGILSSMVTRYVAKVEHTRKKVEELPCDRHWENIADTKTDFKELKDLMTAEAEHTRKKVEELPCDRHWESITGIKADFKELKDLVTAEAERTRKKVEELPCDRHWESIAGIKADFKELKDLMTAEAERTRKKVEELPCDRHWESITGTKADFRELRDLVKSNNGILVKLSTWVMKRDASMIEHLAQKASPMKMTPTGAVLFEQSHAREAMDGNMDFLLEKLETYAPETAFDVEGKAQSVLLGNTDHEMFVEVKRYVYYSPETVKITNPDTRQEEDVTISFWGIIGLMGLYLRDKYLERHPEIK